MMNHNYLILLAGIVFLAVLTGCETDGNSGAQPPRSALINPAFPVPESQVIRHSQSSSSTKSWVSADGTRHSRSKGSSFDVKFDPNAAGAVVAGLLGGGAGYAPETSAANSDNYVGRWNVSVDGRNCSMTLRASSGRGRGSASSFGCFGSELNDLRSWSLRGYELVLNTAFDRQIAALRVTQPNRMDGKLSGGAGVVVWR